MPDGQESGGIRATLAPRASPLASSVPQEQGTMMRCATSFPERFCSVL